MKIQIQKLNEEQIDNMGIRNWPIWTKESSIFDWYYDEQEQCFFLEGRVRVKTETETVEIAKGDFVTFPKGLKCVWEIIEPVRKHYRFG